MNMHPDLFSHADELASLNEEPETEAAAPRGEPLAVPCGFLNRANQRCRGMAHRPVLMDGLQMECRGRPMLHCDPECFRAAEANPAPDQDDWP